MPRRRRRSLSPVDHLTPDDDDDSLTNDDLSPNSNRCPPQQRNAANARERARMRVLSKAFCRLKTTLPWVPADTKLSKLDTLRLASGYIAHLRALLADQPPEDSPAAGRPLNLTWPFTFQQGVLAGCSPDRGTSPRVSVPVAPDNIPILHHQISNCDINMYSNNNNNNNCFTRSNHYQQSDGYYGQIQRDNSFMRHSYSDSMLHTG